MLSSFRKSFVAILALTAAAAFAAKAPDGSTVVPANPETDVYIKDTSKVIIKKTQPGKQTKVIREVRTVKPQVNNVNIYDRSDSLALAKARQDSLAMAEKARRDSLSLLNAEQQLAIERSKRTEMENQLLTTGLLVMDAVYFETARTDISINSKPYLDMLAKMLTKYPKLKIEVAGHTDNVGGDSYNQNLSQGRSAAVMNYLIGAEPSLSGRLTSRGYGESMPKADNNTADGRMHNRRTELQVLNKEALEEYNRPSEQARGPDRTF